MIIAAAQTKPIAGNIEQNINQHLALIKLAIQSNSDVVVFPELSITGYEPTLAKELATTSDDERFNVFQAVANANNITIIIDCPIKVDIKIHIGSIIFQPNLERKTYLKKHLFHTETAYFEGNDSFTTFTMKEQIVAPAICYEISVKEHQECAHRSKSNFYLASVVEDEKLIPTALEKMATTSKNYQMTSLMSNCIGLSGGYQCGGNSAIWNNKGKVVVHLKNKEIGVISYNSVANDCTTYLLNPKKKKHENRNQ